MDVIGYMKKWGEQNLPDGPDGDGQIELPP